MRIYEHIRMRDEGWFAFGIDGYRVHESAYDTVGSLPFSICSVGSTRIAVIFQRAITDDERQRLLATPRADFVDVLSTAALATPPDAPPTDTGRGPPALVDCEILAPIDADPGAVAVAAACALYGDGTFDYEPELYIVRIGDKTFRIEMEFDIDTELWSARVVADVTSAS